MAANFIAGLMNMLQRRAGKLELTARLKRHARTIALQPDNMLAFINRLPAILVTQTFKQTAHRGRPFIRHGPQAIFQKSEFFVLGPNPPVTFWLIARFDPLDEFCLCLLYTSPSPRDRG